MERIMEEGVVVPERMPGQLLAEIFNRGIVVVPGEYEQSPLHGETPKIGSNAPVGQVETAAAELPTRPGEVSPKAINFLGGFGKKVLVVVSDPASLHLNEEDFELLGKILASVKLSIADIALVNGATQALDYYEMNRQLPAEIAFYFGIQPVEIGAPLKFPQFQVQKWNNSTFVYAPSLNEMGPLSPNALALKKELWGAMKKVFG